MPQYRVIEGEQVKRGGKLREAGYIFTNMSAEEAAKISWAVEEVKAAKPKVSPAAKKKAAAKKK